MDTHTDISPLYSNPRRQFVSCVFPSCYKDKEACNSERKSIMEDGEKEFQKKTFKIRKELLRNFQQPMWLPNVSLGAIPSYLSPFSSSLSFSSGLIASPQMSPPSLISYFFQSLFPPCNLPLPPVSAPPSIRPPSPHFLSTSSLPPSLCLLLTFHPSPHLSASHSPGSSCHGVVLLAERGHRRHTDGCTDGQQAVQGGQAHLLHTHTNTHTYRALLCHLNTQPPLLPAFLGQFYRDTNTNTQIHSCTHSYIEL